MGLSQSQINGMVNCVASSSRQSIVDTLSSVIRGNLGSNKWLSDRNRYSNDTTNRIDQDWSPYNIHSTSMKEYISSSCSIHLSDSWDYISAAVSAVFSGNYQKCVHLSYYAELRAAMSILACNGIGVFNGRHVFINSNGNVEKVFNSRMGTHQFAWFALKRWTGSNLKAQSVLSSVNVYGHSIYDWITSSPHLSGVTTTGILASEWLENWSVDLETIGKDRDIRNIISYRPTAIKTSTKYSYNVENEAEFIIDLWKLCEPSGSELFYQMDLLMLRKAIMASFFAKNGRKPKISELDTVIHDIQSNLGINLPANMKKVLTNRELAGKHILFKSAELKSKDQFNAIRPLSVLSRAFLLCRIATGTTSGVMNDASLTSADLDFWLKDIGIKNGLWDPTTFPANFKDLWIDTRDAISEVENWIHTAPDKNKMSFNQIRTETIALEQCQRAHLWGINI